jgi:hypothetical protein
VVLAGFQHRPGVHRGSTALADALRAPGLDLSERARASDGERFAEELAEAFKTLCEARGAGIPPPVAELARGIAHDERRFHEEVAALVP